MVQPIRPGMEEALCDTPMFRELGGLDMDEKNVPYESTILRFRHLLEKQQLNLQILATVNATLTAKGLLLKGGTAADATLIAAQSSIKNSSGERDPEMRQNKKDNQWHFGMKVHIGVDADSGLVHMVIGTAANANDVTQASGWCMAKNPVSSPTRNNRARPSAKTHRVLRSTGTWLYTRAKAKHWIGER